MKIYKKIIYRRGKYMDEKISNKKKGRNETSEILKEKPFMDSIKKDIYVVVFCVF